MAFFKISDSPLYQCGLLESYSMNYNVMHFFHTQIVPDLASGTLLKLIVMPIDYVPLILSAPHYIMGQENVPAYLSFPFPNSRISLLYDLYSGLFWQILRFGCYICQLLLGCCWSHALPTLSSPLDFKKMIHLIKCCK